MGFAPSIPFSLGPDGRVSVETNPNTQTDQRIRALVGTVPSQRVMRLDYGVNLPSLLFEEDFVAEGELLRMTTEALAKWEPGVKVESVESIQAANYDDVPAEGWYGMTPIVDVTVRYRRVDSADSPVSIGKKLHTAVIRVGGEVLEVLGG